MQVQDLVQVHYLMQVQDLVQVHYLMQVQDLVQVHYLMQVQDLVQVRVLFYYLKMLVVLLRLPLTKRVLEQQQEKLELFVSQIV
jgi:hypothetical protein